MIPKIKAYYQKQNRFLEIDGRPSIPKVAKLIEKSLLTRGLL
jgi:adenylate kinase family enzyme